MWLLHHNDRSRFAPQPLKLIVVALISFEDVNNDITIVKHHPAAGWYALDTRTYLEFALEDFVNMLGDGA